MSIAVIGCGVRGSIAAALLAAGGVDELSLVDGGFVEQEDLGVGPLIFTPDLRAAKADALVSKLALIAPTTHAMAFPANLDEDNAGAILLGASAVLDCVGTPKVAEALAAAAAEHGIDLISPQDGYDAQAVATPDAVAAAAEQAGRALALSDADSAS